MKQNLSIPSKVRAEHLNREALVYVRQSTMAQVRFNQESTQRQYALRERALSLGWPEEQIRVIDGDLGISGSGRSKRPGFAQLVTSVSLGEVGAVLGLEISRLARSSADLMKLLELCGFQSTPEWDSMYDFRAASLRYLITSSCVIKIPPLLLFICTYLRLLLYCTYRPPPWPSTKERSVQQ